MTVTATATWQGVDEPGRGVVWFGNPTWEARMPIARVVSFEGVSAERMEELRREIEEGEQPEGLDATEFLVLHDAEGERSLAVVFFDTEEAYRRGDEVLNAMPAPDSPGRRTSVAKYEVAVRMTR